MKLRKITNLLGGTAIYCLASSSINAAVIAGTGWTTDMILENTPAATADATTAVSSTISSGAQIAGYALVETGQSLYTGTGTGVPASGLVTTRNGTLFQLQSYTANNAFVVGGGTFTVAAPASYSSLQFLIGGIGGNTANNFAITVNFSDASTASFGASNVDWGSSQPYDAFNFRSAYYRVSSTTGRQEARFVREREFTLSAPDQAKTINSITVTLNDRQSLFAVSGVGVAAVPEPSSMVLLGLGGLALFARRRR